ncbi:MAG TPA: TIR domain-containing protein, partial [Ktedonobacterales bacterium]
MPDAPRAAPIFISHCHEDNAWCRAFVEGLRHAGADVWYDEHNMGYGALQEKIEHEMRARSIFIVILSPIAVTKPKPWVKREMNAAISLKDNDDARIILPVVAEQCEVPLLWREYKRTSGPGDTGLTATEAAGRVVYALALTPAAMAPAPAPADETAEQAWERGKGLYAQKRYAEALVAYKRAIELDRNNAIYWDNKGDALMRLHQY